MKKALHESVITKIPLQSFNVVPDYSLHLAKSINSQPFTKKKKEKKKKEKPCQSAVWVCRFLVLNSNCSA